MDSDNNEEIKKLKENMNESFAILFSDLDSFELAGELMNNQTFTKARNGQIAEGDIEIPAGPTELMPGPAVSELGDLGIKIQIDKGKIVIKESKILVKKNEKISGKAADLMGKLDIKPFKIGFIPLCAFDKKEKKFYSNIKVDKEKTLEKIKTDYVKALAFSVEINYSTKENISFLIKKAVVHEIILNSLNKESQTPRSKDSETSEEVLQENKSNGEEN